MIYITVPVTNKTRLIEFLANQLSNSMCNVLSSDLDDAVVELHKDLLFASQQALKQCEESQKCPG
jgi:hypothetical protein